MTKPSIINVFDTGRQRREFSYMQDRWIREREVEIIEQDKDGRVIARRKEWRE
jgi:hypothetical protein